MQESVAKISNIFYRDYTEKEKMNFDDPVLEKTAKLVIMLQLKRCNNWKKCKNKSWGSCKN